jgi:hypothetical protein
MYKLITTMNGQSVSKANEDGSVSYIPFDPDNTDYQAYLKWLEEGGVPTPADEVTK